MRNNEFVPRTFGSSVRVSAVTRKRLGHLATRLKVASQEDVIRLALDKLEQSLFWEGFEEEAAEYLRIFPGEEAERASYAGPIADGLRKSKR